MAKRPSATSLLPALLFFSGLVAPFVYSAYALLARPYKEPVRTLIAQQALWDGGQHSPAITYFSSVILLLLGPLSLLFAAVCVRQNLRAWWTQAALAASLPQKDGGLRYVGTPRSTYLTLGAILCFASLSLVRIALAQPEDLAWLGGFGCFAQFFVLFFAPVGFLCLLDGVLPSRWSMGAIAELSQDPRGDEKEEPEFSFRLDGHSVSVPAGLGQQLCNGDPVAVRESAIFDRLLELRRPSRPEGAPPS
jgi:hypothetical protein